MLPPYISREQIGARLPLIFPEGTANRPYLIRELSASAIFTMLYIGAVEGAGILLGPIHIYRMTDEQASATDDDSRITYRDTITRRKKGEDPEPPGRRWYADNTREPIRDETLREGLVQIGAVIAAKDIPTTSSKPRYALKADFAALFDPALDGEPLAKAVSDWQEANLSKAAQMRLRLAGLGAATGDAGVFVTFPNGETRKLEAGPSSEISKAVIESFAPKFLEQPGVLWLSTSGKKVVKRDDELAGSINLTIQPDKELIDIILVDLAGDEPLLVFVEVVASDGPITERRQAAIYAMTDAAGVSRSQVAFVTAYGDRLSAAFKKTVSSLAWSSFAWFVSEPDQLVIMRGERGYLREWRR